MRRLRRLPPPHRWSDRARIALLVVTLASGLCPVLVPAAVAFWMLSEPPPPAQYLLFVVLGVLLLWALLTLPALVLYIADARLNAATEGELRWIWPCLHLALANLSMIFYWFLYLRPRASAPGPAETTATG